MLNNLLDSLLDNIQKGECNNCDWHEINKVFGSFQLQYRQPMKIWK